MEIEKAIGICKNLLKIEYDGCFGTKVYHPHSMSIEDVEAIETVLNALDNSISKDKIKAYIDVLEEKLKQGEVLDDDGEPMNSIPLPKARKAYKHIIVIVVATLKDLLKGD